MEQQPQQAVEYYRKAIEKKPYVQSAYYNLAKAYRLLGDITAATEQLELFQQMKGYYDQTYAIEGALAEDPMNTTLRLKLAEVHLAHKHISAAITTYQSLIRLRPELATGYDKLGRLYMNLNMPQRAIPFFQKVLALNPDTVEAHVRLGWLYTTLKAFDKAESHLQIAIEKMPQLILAYHGLAEIYTKQGHLQKAIDVYRHITEIAPDDSDAWKALQSLERLQQRSQTTPINFPLCKKTNLNGIPSFYRLFTFILISLQYCTIAVAEPIFVDVTESAGITFVHTDGRSGLRLFNEFLGSGGGFFRL